MNGWGDWLEGEAGRGEFPEMNGYAYKNTDTHVSMLTCAHTHTHTQIISIDTITAIIRNKGSASIKQNLFY